MTGEMGCEQVRELAPELAIGIADGQERASALRHTATCADCRRLVSDLSTVVDEVLLLAPAQEPPSGFGSRTVGLLVPPVRRRRRWVTGLAIAASLVVALALGSGAVFLGTADDRRLADGYRAVLAQGHGSFFVAAPLRGPGGTLGTVFGYQGRPSWLFATVRLPAGAPERFDVRLVTRDGRTLALGSTVLSGSNGTWGGAIPVDLGDASQLRLDAADGELSLVASIHGSDPWGSDG